MGNTTSLKMKTLFRTSGWWLFAVLLGVLGVIYFKGIRTVPFHPDESTQLYMSRDFDRWLSNPWAMAYNPQSQNDLQQHYRKLDAPLTRYLLGLGRAISGLAALPVDWDWGKTWQENQSAGALPSEELLFAGRLSIALLFPLSLWFLFLTGKQMGGTLTGALAVLLLASNSLILLHTRRAMAEGALILTVCFALWSLTQAVRSPWLAGLGVALALNAKQSALALLPVGLIAVLWRSNPLTKRSNHRALAILQYIGVIILLTLALNPILWRNPGQASQAAWQARQDLLQRQLADARRLAPESVLETPMQRAVVMVANVYLVKPMFAEVGNYSQDTAASEQVYLANPANHLLRNPVGAGILLFLTLYGISLAIYQMILGRTTPPGVLHLVLLATIAQAAALIWTIPFPWQRYILPMAPLVCLWAAFGITQLVSPLVKKIKKTG